MRFLGLSVGGALARWLLRVPSAVVPLLVVVHPSSSSSSSSLLSLVMPSTGPPIAGGVVKVEGGWGGGGGGEGRVEGAGRRVLRRSLAVVDDRRGDEVRVVAHVEGSVASSVSSRGQRLWQDTTNGRGSRRSDDRTLAVRDPLRVLRQSRGGRGRDWPRQSTK